MVPCQAGPSAPVRVCMHGSACSLGTKHAACARPAGSHEDAVTLMRTAYHSYCALQPHVLAGRLARRALCVELVCQTMGRCLRRVSGCR